MDHLEHELKKEFQLERMIFFSDAVFAIAITLLVLEIRIPEVTENVSDKVLLQALGNLVPKFIGFIISFMMIGLYWTVHHRMFGIVTSYTPALLRLNLFFLFFIVLMPFSMGFYGDYMGYQSAERQLKVPMTFYVLNLCFVGVLNYIMWRYISNPKHKLIEHPVDPIVLKMGKARAIIVPIMVFCMLPVAYIFNVLAAVYIPMLVPIAMKITKSYYSKKMKPQHQHHH